ncbi:DUF6053 domain-containing protein [Lysobacter enzymogenes]
MARRGAAIRAQSIGTEVPPTDRSREVCDFERSGRRVGSPL